MKPSYQLSLFPARGFGLLCLGELLVDHMARPAVEPTRAAAHRRLRRCARGESAWTVGYTTVVPVEVHDDEGEAPLYIIGAADGR